MRLGEQHLSCVVTDKASGQLNELSYWTTGEMNAGDLAELLEQQKEFTGPFYQVNICYDYPGSMMVPSAGFRQEDAGLLNSTLPGAGDTSLSITEWLAEWQLYNVYTAPGEIHALLMKKFPAARFWHQSTVGLKSIRAAAAEGCLQADFRHHDFSLIAVRSGKLLLARSFGYSTPEDVLYYLLKTCRQFSLSQNEVSLELSGLVDKQSALYKELYQYFSQIRLRENDWKMNDGEFPAHFFTSLKDLSVCVS
jgi:hypothetical protein